MRVEQVMTRIVESCSPRDTLEAAARVMRDRDCGCVPVVMPEEDGLRVFGMLTDRDICMAAYARGCALSEIPVSAAMSRDVCSCTPQDPLAVALKVLCTNQLRRLPVVDAHDHLVGLLSLADIARETTDGHARVTGSLAVGEAVGRITQPRPAHRELVPTERTRTRNGGGRWQRR